MWHPDLEAIRNHVSHIIEDVRGLAWELRPSMLDVLGVVPAIRTYNENFSGHYGVTVTFNTNLRRRLGAQEETTLYRMIQEALTNVGKYADASEAIVTLEDQPDAIRAAVGDKGVGFARQYSSKGVGLFSMEERARSVGGKLMIHSEPGLGTEVVLVIPHKNPIELNE